MEKKHNITRICFSALFYLLYLGVIATNVYIIKICGNNKISYYYGSLLFLPIFIISFWISQIYEKLSSGSGCIPEKINKILLKICDISNFALVICWVIIYLKFPDENT